MAERFGRRFLELPEASVGSRKRICGKLSFSLARKRQANESPQFGGGFELALMVRHPPLLHQLSHDRQHSMLRLCSGRLEFFELQLIVSHVV
jgi:hypothetical protein